MAKIYVSSTFIDLEDYRTQVERVIRRMGHEAVAMEYYDPEGCCKLTKEFFEEIIKAKKNAS